MIRLAALVAALAAGAVGVGWSGATITWALVALPWASGVALLGAVLWHRRSTG